MKIELPNDTFAVLRTLNQFTVPAKFSCPDVDWLIERGYAEIKSGAELYKFMYGDAEEKKGSWIIITDQGVDALNAFLSEGLATKVHAEYEEDMVCLREPANDGWDRGNYNNNARFIGIYVNDQGWYSNTVYINAKPGEEFFLVWITYRSGNTFGYTSGKFDVAGACKSVDCLRMLEWAADTMHKDYFGGCESVNTETLTMPEKTDDED